MNSNTLFDHTTKKIICDYIYSFLKDPSLELEFRIGSFQRNNTITPPQTTFISSVEIDFFYKLKNVISKHTTPKILKTTEKIYKTQNNKGVLKSVNNLENGASHFMNKYTVKKYNIYDLDLRIALSNEKVMKHMDKNIQESEILIRNKNRESYILHTNIPGIKLSYDFTIVSDEQNVPQTYEIEIEVLKDFCFQNISNDIVESISTFVHNVFINILCTRQSNYFVTPHSVKKTVMKQYNELVQSYYFIGVQPETLQKEHLGQLTKNYSVTDKADGERCLLFINNNSEVFLMDNSLKNIKRISAKTSYKNCILDGELINKDTRMCFCAFDTMFVDGNDLRGNTQYNLKARLDFAHSIIQSITDPCDYYTFEVKEFFFGNVFLASKFIWCEKKFAYQLDGLVFTPTEEPYPKTRKWSSLLKWKPSHLNTIDFYSVKLPNSNTWELYVGGESNYKSTEKKSNYQNQKVLFDVAKLLNENSNNINSMTTSIENSMLDPTTNQPFISNTVIEFFFDKQINQFVPLKTRWDKTLKNSMGNFVKVACDIWKNIWYPVTEDQLFNAMYKPNEVKTDFYFKEMRQFHNYIKMELYNKYTKNIDYLLELGSGKGGDLQKWMHNNVKHVDGYDIDYQSIQEAYKRLSQLQSQKMESFDYKFYQSDLTKEKSFDQLYKNYTYDTISSQFAFHYFCTSQDNTTNTLKNISSLLKKDGYFIGTIIDHKALNDFLDTNSINYKTIDYELIYYLQKNRTTHATDSVFNNDLIMYLNGNNYLSSVSKEPIVNFDVFCDLCNNVGLELVESKQFNDFFENSHIKLTQVQKEISGLYRTFVFKKLDDSVIIKPKPVIQSVERTFSSILQDSDDIQNIDLTTWKTDLRLVQFGSWNSVFKLLNSCQFIYNPYSVVSDLSVDRIVLLKKTNFVYLKNFEKVFEKGFIESSNIEFFKNTFNPNWVFVTESKIMMESTDNMEPIEKTGLSFLNLNNKMFFSFNSKMEILEFLHNLFTIKEISTENKENQVPIQEESESNEGPKDSQEKTNSLEQLEKYTIKKLKEVLKENGLKQSGSKSELISRLRNYYNLVNL